MKRYVMSLLIVLSISSCGMHSPANEMQHHTDMHSGEMTMPTPNMQAPIAATVKNIRLSDPWARPSTKGENSAGYVIINNGGEADTLVAVTGAVADSIELHMVENVDGVMQMRPVAEGIPIPGNNIQTLQPGGYHIMLIGLSRDLRTGDTFDSTLTFAQAGDVTISVTVR
ncbi:MAG: copper chaperone PCu(A)C [Roseiflexaceae bacterium]